MERLNESRIGAVITDAFAVRAACGTVATPHAQHGVAVLVGVDSDVTVTTDGAQVRGRVVVVPPHLRHAVACPGPTLGLLYDPDRLPRVDGYARARPGPFVPERELRARISAAVAAHRAGLPDPEVLGGLADAAATWLAAPRRPPDPRVVRVLAALRDPSCEREPVLAGAGVSPAHLQALFVRDVGLPIRRFQLWRRLLVGVAALARHDATTAAHLAGFADLAHFSRTCRDMLGYSPTALRTGLLQA